MLTNRAFLLACATVTTLGLTAVSSTPADARPCHNAEFHTSRGKGVFAQVHHQECHFRGCHPGCHGEAGGHGEAGCSQAGRHGEAGRGKQAAANAPAATAAPAVSTCLTKEYLDNGAVKFRDNCTGEWAQTPVSSR